MIYLYKKWQNKCPLKPDLAGYQLTKIKVKYLKLNSENQKSKILENFKKNLLRFFDKKITTIKTPHKLVGNQIQKKVWAELKKIKCGQTETYGKIAKKYKLSPRHVG